MRTAKELAELITGERFQALNSDQKHILEEVANTLLLSQAFESIVSAYLSPDVISAFMAAASIQYHKLIIDIFGPWDSPDVKLVPLPKVEESPSD